MKERHDRNAELPIDRGWAWMVLVAVTTWNFIMGGTIKSYGLLYVEFISLFQSSPTETGIIGLAFGIVAMLISPISGRLSDSYSARMMSVFGGVVACAGIIATGNAPNVWIAVAAFGLLFGGAVGVADGPILATLGRYFEKRRTFANGIAFAGASVGSLVMAPLISFLIDEFSIKGAMLLLGGLWLNICVVGALLRPISSYARTNRLSLPPDDDTEKEFGNDDHDALVEQKVPSVRCDIKVQIIAPTIPSEVKAEINSLTREEQEEWDKTRRKLRIVQSKSEHDRITPKPGNQDPEKVNSMEESLEKAHLPSPFVAALKAENRLFTKTYLASSLPNALHIQHTIKENANADNKARSLFGSNISIPSLLYRGDSIMDLARASALEKKPDGTQDLGATKSTYLEFLINPLLIRDLFILGCGYYAYYTPIVSLPAYGKEMGIDKFEIAWTVGLIGMIEVPSRICLSWMTDRFKLRPASVLTVSFFVTGVCGQSFVFAPNHMTMIAYACVHGVLGGLCMVLMGSVMAECVGIKDLGSAMGLAVMQMNLAVSLSSTSAGAMKQLTGSYGSVFRVSSGMYLLGALVYCLTPLGFFKDPYKACRSAKHNKAKTTII